jgi:hypothetical protein
MAQQIAGLCFLEGTFDQLTFYKMEGKYYVREKSSLTSERVKTAPEFGYTMYLAGLLSRASKIGSIIYKALPPSWRQFWMYRSFTGEAFTMMKEQHLSDEVIKQRLWKTYVEYWEQWEAVNADNPALPIIKAPKQQKIRKRRVYSLESLMRMKDRNGKPKYKNPEEEERKRKQKALNDAAWQRLLDAEKQEAEQQAQILQSSTIAETTIVQEQLLNEQDTIQTTAALTEVKALLNTLAAEAFINQGEAALPLPVT